jgi:hypothetical protein
MLVAYNDLLPLIYDAETFKDPHNRDRIRKQIQQLNDSTQSITQHAGRQLSGGDTLLRVGVEGIQSTMNRAVAAYDRQDFSEAQHLLQSSVNFCFQCHLSSEAGLEIESWSEWNPPEGLNSFQQAKVYGATRQFGKAKKALQAYVAQLSEKGGEEKDLIAALQMAIKLAVYRDKDRGPVVQQISQLRSQPGALILSMETQQVLNQWEMDLAKLKPVSAKQQTAELKKLLSRQPNALTYSKQHYVRAVQSSKVLRRGLSESRFFDTRSKILFRLGHLYRQFPEKAMVPLSDSYFEDCVRLAASAGLSRRCFQGLKKNLLQRYQAGVVDQLPKGERDFLVELEKLTSDRIQDF